MRRVHLFALYALAVAQPLLGLLGDNAEFFVSRRASGAQVVVFALLVVLVPPLVLVGIVGLGARVDERLGRALQLTAVGALVAALAIQLLKKPGDWGTVPMIAVAVLIGVGGAIVYARSAAVRTFMSYLTPAPLVVLVLFLVVSPVHRLVFPTDIATAGIRTTSTTPVVMVELDEVSMETFLDPQRRIDAAAYPNLARLADDATVYRKFTAAGDETTRVTSSLLTGVQWKPGEQALPIAAEHPRNLFTLLGGAFRMRVSEEASDLCPPKVCPLADAQEATMGDLLHDAGIVYAHVVAPPAIEEDLTPTDQTLGPFADDGGRRGKNTVLHNLGGGGRPERFAEWVASIDSSREPTLYFKHLLLPHVPWEYLPDGRRYSTDPFGNVHGASDEHSFSDPWLLEQGYQRHLLQAEYTDTLLGALLDRLHETGIYDRALIVVTADNGESFLKRGHNRHIADSATAADIASTPLFIKLPGQRRGRYSDVHVRSVDLLPTLADALDVRIPWPISGRSFLRSDYVADRQVVVFPQGEGPPPPVRMSLEQYERAAAATLTAKKRLFAHGIYAIGPDPELVGRPAPTTAPASAMRARVDQPGRLANVDTRSTFLPSQITGRLTGAGARAGLPVAVAVNDRIAATGWSAQLKDNPGVILSFMIPPRLLHDGRNNARFYLIDGPRLVPL
jgi:Sulfatase